MADEPQNSETEVEREEPREEEAAPVRRWRPAEEPTCCGSGCIDCPF